MNENLNFVYFLQFEIFEEVPVVKGSEVIGREMKIKSDCCWARHA